VEYLLRVTQKLSTRDSLEVNDRLREPGTAIPVFARTLPRSISRAS